MNPAALVAIVAGVLVFVIIVGIVWSACELSGEADDNHNREE